MRASVSPSRRADVHSVPHRRRVAQVVAGLVGERLEAARHLRMLGGDVVRLADVGLQVEEGHSGPSPLVAVGRAARAGVPARLR